MTHRTNLTSAFLMEGMNTISFLRHVRQLLLRSVSHDLEPLTVFENEQLQLGIKTFGRRQVRSRGGDGR